MRGQGVGKRFFERPILNSPYAYPAQHWELDPEGQPTDNIVPLRRRSELITPVPKPKKRKRTRAQAEFILDAGDGLSSAEQAQLPDLQLGEGLWRIGQRAFVVRHVATDNELRLFDTSSRMVDGTPKV